VGPPGTGRPPRQGLCANAPHTLLWVSPGKSPASSISSTSRIGAGAPAHDPVPGGPRPLRQRPGGAGRCSWASLLTSSTGSEQPGVLTLATTNDPGPSSPPGRPASRFDQTFSGSAQVRGSGRAPRPLPPAVPHRRVPARSAPEKRWLSGAHLQELSRPCSGCGSPSPRRRPDPRGTQSTCARRSPPQSSARRPAFTSDPPPPGGEGRLRPSLLLGSADQGPDRPKPNFMTDPNRFA